MTKKKQTVDYDSFNPETSKNGFVNDAAKAPANLLKFLKANNKKKKALDAVKKEAGGY